MKKIIAFDLDGTLADSKSPISDEMALLFGALVQKYTVCVISGGKFDQFKLQLINNLHIPKDFLSNLHVLPTCGTKYLHYDVSDDDWKTVYSEDIPQKDKQRIKDAIDEAVDHFGYREKKIYGEAIEDRGSQITFSALGQDIVDVLGPEGVKIKLAWDPDNIKKNNLRDYIADLISDYEVRVGGISSVDITRPGIDKAYGMMKLIDITKSKKSDILFVGDRLDEGGNDYPVKAFGIDTIAVKDWHETALIVRTLILSK